MKNLILKHSVLTAVIISSISVASANDELVFETVNNTQVNLTDVLSDVLFELGTAGEQASIAGTAYGNDFQVQADESAPIFLNTDQRSNTDNIISNMDITFETGGDMELKSEAIANRAVVVSKNSNGGNTINNTQQSGAAIFADLGGGGDPGAAGAFVAGGEARGVGDPLSDVDVFAQSIDNFSLESTAGGNLGQFVLAGHGNSISNIQQNDVMNNSIVDVTFASVENDLNITSKAWGNSAVIVLGNVPQQN